MALSNLLRAALGSLPLIPRGDRIPDRTLVIDELPIDASNVAAYAAVTGLRFADAVPLTYPFALTFPTVMELITGFDFPFAAMGAVHGAESDHPAPADRGDRHRARDGARREPA